MSLRTKPDLMDYRILAILQIALESDELLSSQDVEQILRVEQGIVMEIKDVTEIMEQLADSDYLIRYSPTGFLLTPDTTYYLGPKLANQEGRRYD